MFPDFSSLAILAGTISFSHGYLAEAEKYFGVTEKPGGTEAVAGLANEKNNRKTNLEAAAEEK